MLTLQLLQSCHKCDYHTFETFKTPVVANNQKLHEQFVRFPVVSDKAHAIPLRSSWDLCICSFWELCCMWWLGQYLLKLQF